MTRRTAVDGMFLTLAIVVSYIEVLLPIPVGIPGVKIGLANGVIMVLLFFTGWKRALFEYFFHGDFEKSRGIFGSGTQCCRGSGTQPGTAQCCRVSDGKCKNLLLCAGAAYHRNHCRHCHRSAGGRTDKKDPGKPISVRKEFELEERREKESMCGHV